MGYIYKVENKENGKVYIGQTKYTIEWRWHTHLYATFTSKACDHNSILHKAIRKYGIDAFTVSEIESCNANLLDEREIYWIKHYNSTDKSVGYNITPGGNRSISCSDEEILKWWNCGYGSSEIARLIPKPISRNTVRQRLLGMGISAEEIRKRGRDAISRSNSKYVYQYSKDGKFIKSFYSARQAADETNCCVGNICSCANGNVKSAGGYLWSYEKKDCLDELKIRRGFTLVGKYDENGTLIEAYVSVTAASNNSGISRKRLTIACDREELYKGFIWKYLNIEGGVIHV